MQFNDLKSVLSTCFFRRKYRRQVLHYIRNYPDHVPHYVRDYRNHVSNLLQALPEADAMALAVGGEFQSFGPALKDLLLQCGLHEEMTIVDVGCGSGRLAYALRQMKIGYIGTDVVPDLIEYARKLCGRPDWRFQMVDDLRIPAEDSSVDMVVFISVFTHLRHEEAFIYLTEAKRVLKSGGLILFTFLDFSQPHHWVVFQNFADKLRSGTAPPHIEQFIDKTAIAAWASHLGLAVKQIFDGSQKYIHLSQEVTFDNGRKLHGDFTIGQSACLMQKI